MSLWRQSGKMPRQLEEAPDIPEMLTYLWHWFLEMHADRRMGDMKAERISSADMKDWSWATGNTLEHWERRAIRRIDNEWFKAQNQ